LKRNHQKRCDTQGSREEGREKRTWVWLYVMCEFKEYGT